MMNLFKAIIAGFVATLVMSALMLIKGYMGFFPDLNVIEIIDKFNNTYVGAPTTPWSGWLTHFCIGSIGYGVLFTLLRPKLTENSVFNGIIVGVIGWLAMMLIIMPLAGFGLFAILLGEHAALITLGLHVIYGIVLGFTYGKLCKS